MSHLSPYEIQVQIQSKRATLGITDHDVKKKGRIANNIHAYVRASPTILAEAVEKLRGWLNSPPPPPIWQHYRCNDGLWWWNALNGTFFMESDGRWQRSLRDGKAVWKSSDAWFYAITGSHIKP